MKDLIATIAQASLLLAIALQGSTQDRNAARPVTAERIEPAPPASDSSPIDPSITLRPDAFDAPAATAVAEARKAAGPGGKVAGPAATVPSTSAIPHTAHESGQIKNTNATASEILYACPMHPEVSSATPGTCPKCGMTLVKKETGKEP
jgi:hypothetical protein